MIKNIYIHLLTSFILSTQSLLSSDITQENRFIIPSAHETHDPQITTLASHLKDLNTTTIQNYQWTADTLEKIYKPIERTQKSDVHTIFSLLTASKNVNAPLSTIVSDEDALIIKEACLNVLCNEPCNRKELMIKSYDLLHQNEKISFHGQYGNHKKSEKLSSAHHFATNLWKYTDKELVSLDPDNTMSIQELINLSQTAIDKTGEQWLNISEKINEKQKLYDQRKILRTVNSMRKQKNKNL